MQRSEAEATIARALARVHKGKTKHSSKDRSRHKESGKHKRKSRDRDVHSNLHSIKKHGKVSKHVKHSTPHERRPINYLMTEKYERMKVGSGSDPDSMVVAAEW
jgi:hypothetical protein